MNEGLGPDSTGSLWKRFDTTYRTWSTTRKLVTFLVSFALVFGLSVAVTATIDKATGAEQRICQSGGHPELQCQTNAQLVKKFHKGKLGRINGFHPAAYFKNPRVFRHKAHHKMVVFLRHHPKVEGVLRHKYLTKRDPGCTDYCLAWKAYGDLMAHSNCGPAAPLNTNPQTCQPFETSHSKAVVRGITIAYCGGALVLGALGVFSTDGAAAPAAATIYGGIGCGWGFMASFF